MFRLPSLRRVVALSLVTNLCAVLALQLPSLRRDGVPCGAPLLCAVLVTYIPSLRRDGCPTTVVYTSLCETTGMLHPCAEMYTKIISGNTEIDTITTPSYLHH